MRKHRRRRTPETVPDIRRVRVLQISRTSVDPEFGESPRNIPTLNGQADSEAVKSAPARFIGGMVEALSILLGVVNNPEDSLLDLCNSVLLRGRVLGRLLCNLGAKSKVKRELPGAGPARISTGSVSICFQNLVPMDQKMRLRPSDRNFPVHNGFLTKPKSQPAVDCARSRGRMRASLCPKREAFSKHVDRVLRLGIIIIDKLFVHGWRTGHGVANDSKETRAKPGSKLGKANNPATSVKITPSRSFLLFARYPPAVRAPLRGLAKTDPIRGRTLEKARANGTSSPTTPRIDNCATFCIRK
ncbi:hypothetical protein GEV33_007199 [Tenebrio molitor]|uniref:Uncharacterized protein n=1 Tax=Tenebrio molitor TaxID=7067 RepID=A0A8J6HJP8_TENMO|nr:hypothetical protein GEV33_007199 [Tenebrio molitor]